MVTLSRLNSHNSNKTSQYILNERINAEKVLVLEGENNLGVMSKWDAVKLAREKEMDLVLIAPQAIPPVAKILDFNKFLYEERKKKASAKAKSKKSEIKELRLSPTIGDGDLLRMADRAKEFIKEGDRVKATIFLKGRERAYPEIALEKIEKFTKEMEDTAKAESSPKHMGNLIVAVYVKK